MSEQENLNMETNMPNKQSKCVNGVESDDESSDQASSNQSNESENSNAVPSTILSGNYEETGQKIPCKMLNSPFLYTKRSGTSGIGGQLYETKLLSLFLLRALNHKEITRFSLATNVGNIGAFDDIVLKYETNCEEKPKVLFIQAKHKEEPDQNKIKLEDFFKEYGDFCLYKYFDSYMNIRSKFNLNNNDNIFNTPFKNVDCRFIIYTPAIENIRERDIVIEDTSAHYVKFLQTSNTGKAFRLVFSDDDVERLLYTVLDMRTQILGKTFMKFIFKDNYKNMLIDDIMKTYHVFLAQQVIEVISDTELKNPYLEGRFRETFLASKNIMLKILKQAIFKEFSLKHPTWSFDQLEKVVADFTFKLPLNFGNLNFHIGGSSKKSDQRFVYLCSKMKQLIDRADSCGSSVIQINDDIVGPGEILQRKDFEIYRLGGLIGNLLVLDDETHMLKFNESTESLPHLVGRLFEMLKKQYPDGVDLHKYRFDVIASRFPELLLGRDMHLWRFVREFLDTVIFYTNQARENDVEKVLKHDITKYYEFNLRKDTLSCRMKCESVFLKVHDTIQKWWKQPNQSSYLNEKCKYYDEAKEQLNTYSLLNTLHFLYTTKLNSYDVKFNDQSFILNENGHGVLNIVTDNITFTSIKLTHCLHRSNKSSSHIFVNLDLIVADNCFNEILSELREVKLKTIFVTCENNNLYDKILTIWTVVRRFMVVITKKEIQQIWSNINKFHPFEYEKISDERTAFIDVCVKSQKKILDETNVMFQGSIVLLKTLISTNIKIIDTAALFAILNHENIQIGQKITSMSYTEFEECYVQRSICRYITLNPNRNVNLYIVSDTDAIQTVAGDKRDVVVISDKIELFLTYCEKYPEKNIHWFDKIDGNYVWQKSNGSLSVLSEQVDKGSCDSFKFKPKTLFDIDEKIVLLAAEPGMGKSTFMTYLTIQTKINYPSNWILRINCLDYKNLFSYWHENKTVIDLKEVIKLLYVASNLLVTHIKTTKNVTESICYNFSINVNPDGDILLSDTNDLKGLARLEVELFNDLYNNGQLVIIIDGFDEISPDYLNEVITLLEILENSKVSRLWVAMRPYNIINKLEQKFGRFAFSLEKLSSNDQYDLLVKLWGKIVKEKKNDRLRLYVENFMKAIFLTLHDHEQNFTSIPLHIYMIAEIYKDFFKDYYDPFIHRLPEVYFNKIEGINTLTLYETFVNIKFYNIHFGEKKPYIYDRDPDMKKMIEKERKDFIKHHKKMAAHAIFKKNVQCLFSAEDRNEISDALDRVRQGEERTGIIDRVVDDEPQFVHLTFAEYFATLYLCDKLKTKECSVEVWIYLLDTIFITDEGVKIRKFFNLKLSTDKELFQLSENLKYKQELFYTLMKQHEATSLSIALLEYTERSAIFLLQCIKDVLTKNNLGDFINHITRRNKISCTFCSVINVRFKNVLDTVLGLIKDVDKERLIELFTCGDVPLFNALGIAITYSGAFPKDKELFDVMLTSIEDIDVALTLFTMPCNMGLLRNTIVHVLIMNFHSLRLILKHLLRFNQNQRMIIFNAVDSDGKLAAHFAAEQGDLDFFTVLDILLERDRFIKICMTCNRVGKTPFDYLLKSVRNTKVFELVKPLKELYENYKLEQYHVSKYT